MLGSLSQQTVQPMQAWKTDNKTTRMMIMLMMMQGFFPGNYKSCCFFPLNFRVGFQLCTSISVNLSYLKSPTKIGLVIVNRIKHFLPFNYKWVSHTYIFEILFVLHLRVKCYFTRLLKWTNHRPITAQQIRQQNFSSNIMKHYI